MTVIDSFKTWDDAVTFCAENLMTGVDIEERHGVFHVIDPDGETPAPVDAQALEGALSLTPIYSAEWWRLSALFERALGIH